jgi:hypothetical protein
MKRVGADIAASDRWRDAGASYAAGIDGAYHQHRLDVVSALLPDLAGKVVVPARHDDRRRSGSQTNGGKGQWQMDSSCDAYANLGSKMS